METWMKSLEDSTSSNRMGTNLSNQDKTKDFDTTASLTVNSTPELEMGLFRLPLYTVRYLWNSPPLQNICLQRQLPITITYSVTSNDSEMTEKTFLPLKI